MNIVSTQRGFSQTVGASDIDAVYHFGSASSPSACAVLRPWVEHADVASSLSWLGDAIFAPSALAVAGCIEAGAEHVYGLHTIRPLWPLLGDTRFCLRLFVSVPHHGTVRLRGDRDVTVCIFRLPPPNMTSTSGRICGKLQHWRQESGSVAIRRCQDDCQRGLDGISALLRHRSISTLEVGLLYRQSLTSFISADYGISLTAWADSP